MTRAPIAVILRCTCIALVLACAPPASDATEAVDIAALTTQADSGNREARHELCYRYLYGEGVSKDYTQALRWCELASTSGDAASQTLYAEILYNGYGTPVDLTRAFELYKSAADRDFPHAQFVVALMYGKGQGTGQDASQAMKYLRRAADNGYEPAVELLRKR